MPNNATTAKWPQNVTAEMIVLSSAINYDDAREYIVQEITAEYFYARQFRELFDIIKKIVDKGYKKADAMLIGQEFDPVLLSEVMRMSAYPADGVDIFIKKLRNKKVERDVMMVNNRIAGILQDDNDHEHKTSEILSLINEIGEISGGKTGLKHIKELLPIAIQQFKDTCDGKIVGIPTGISDLDRAIAGLFFKEYTIIAGAPGDGKSSLALTFAKNMSEYFLLRAHGEGVAVFSLEMEAAKLTNRMISMFSGGDVSGDHIRGVTKPGTVALNGYMAGAELLSKQNIYIDDTPGRTAGEIVRGVQISVKKNNLKAVIIDHFSLVGYDGNDNAKEAKHNKMAEITRGLQVMFKKEGVIGIVLVQLGRDAYGKKPTLKDLSETKALGQDANNVLMLWKPDQEQSDKVVICCTKGRDGGVGDYYCDFSERTTEFTSMDPRSQEDFKDYASGNSKRSVDKTNF